MSTAVVESVAVNTDLIIDWVAALRSGEYRQSTGRLRTPEGWCCLGVLTDIAIKKGLIDAEWEDHPDYGWSQYSIKWREGNGTEHYQSQILPDDLHLMVGLASASGDLPGRSEWRMPDPHERKDQFFFRDSDGMWRFASLAGANDDGVGFTAIADAVESVLLPGNDTQDAASSESDTQVAAEIGGGL